MKILILAGGKSRRMGRNKALIERPDGIRQLDYIIALARTVSQEVIISTNQQDIAPDGIETLPDLNPGDGPLGAMASFHTRYPGEPVLLLGCDHFLIDEAALQDLVTHHDTDASASAYPNRIDQRPEPLCAIYEAASLKRAEKEITAGNYCARHFLESLSPTVLELKNPVALDNANSPEDLDEAFAKITQGIREITVRVLYFAKLREARGVNEETVNTCAHTTAGLYEELRFLHRLPLKIDSLRCARNGDFCDWSTRISQGDEIVFIPPVAGG